MTITKSRNRNAKDLPSGVSSRSSQNLHSHKHEFLASAAIFFFALALRGAYLAEIKSTPLFSNLIGDALSYDTWARDIAGGNWLGNQVFYQAPLYPYFLGVLYAVFGRNLLLVRLIQIVLGSLSCVILAQAGRVFFTRRAGIVAGLILALYPPAIFSDCLIQKSVLDLLFMSLLLYLLALMSRRLSSELCISTGVVLGFLALTRENALALPVMILAWLLVHYRGESGSTRLQHAAWIVLGSSLVLLPVAVRNKAVGGDFYLTTSQLGPNFYIGNNKNATGMYAGLIRGHESAEYERRDATDLAETAVGRKLNAGEVSSYWTEKTLSDIRAEPVRWLRLLAWKWLLTWNTIEIGDTEDQYAYAEWSFTLKELSHLLHFGILCPLALLGICLTWPERHRIWILYVLLVGYAATVTLFYVFARYRLPLVPLTVLFAAVGLTEAFTLLVQRRLKLLISVGAPALIVAVFVNWPVIAQDEGLASTHFNVANALVKQGRSDAAIGHYQETIRLRPNFAIARTCFGDALANLGRLDEAVSQHREAVRLEFNSALTHESLASVLVKAGLLEEADKEANESIRLDPSYADPYITRGFAHERRGQTDAAVSDYRAALRLDAGFAGAHYSLGSLLLRQGKLDEAIEHLSAATRLQPNSAEMHNDLGFALAAKNEFDRAAEHYREAIRLKPDLAEARINLAAALQKQGHPSEALEQLSEAVRLRPQLSLARRNLADALASLGKTKEALEQIDQVLKLNPGDVDAHFIMAKVQADLGVTGKAILHYREVLKGRPEDVGALNNLAWILATTPEEKYRNGTQAVDLARRACEAAGYKEVETLDTLAAAYAAAGRFNEARTTALKAVETASASGQKDLAESMRQRLRLYEKGRPYLEQPR